MVNKDFALNYLENGWSVFPTNGKKPIIDEWKPYSIKRPTKEQVIEWWTKWPDADIAGITGEISGIVVVDVDGGEVPPLPPTAVSETSPGHYQYFLKYPGFPLQNSVKVIAPNIDIKADGGYVILPPSRHFNKNTGKQDFTYRWLITPKDGGLADLPESVLGKIKTKKSLDQIITGSSQGSRNNDATSYAGSLLFKHQQNEWESVCWPALRGWNLANNPPLDEKELRAVFESIASRETDKTLRQNLTLYGVGTEVTRSYTPLHISELSSEENPLEWIWEGYIAKGHQTLISALWKAGKTTLITLFLKALQEGKALAGQNTNQCKVLILSEESGSLWARRRDENGLTLNFWVLPRPIRQKLSSKEWVSLLEQMAKFCKENKIDLFIIDTLSGFWSADNENDAARVSEALLPITYLLEEKIAVLLVHHFRKSGGDEGTAARGSGQLGAAVDIIVEFTRLNGTDPNCTQRVLKTYSRFDESPKEVVIDYVDDEYITVGTKADVSELEKLQKVLDALENYPEGITISELDEKWNEDEHGHKPSRKTLERSISKLINKQRVAIVGQVQTKGRKAPLYAKLPETKSLRQVQIEHADTKSNLPLNQPQTSPHVSETKPLSQSSPERKEAIHDQRPKLGIPTYD